MELKSFSYTICVPTESDTSGTIERQPWLSKESGYTFVQFDTYTQGATGSWYPKVEGLAMGDTELPTFTYRSYNPKLSTQYRYKCVISGNDIVCPSDDGIKVSNKCARIIGINSPLLQNQLDYSKSGLFEGMGINIENSPVQNIESFVCSNVFSMLSGEINLEKAFYNVMIKVPPCIGYPSLSITSLKNFWQSRINKPFNIDNLGFLTGDFSKCVSIENAFANSSIYGLASPVIAYLTAQNPKIKTKGCFKNCENLADYDKIPNSWK